MTRSTRLGIALSWVLGCSAGPPLESPEPPDFVRYLSALAFAPDDGRLVGSAEIIERTEAWRLELELDEDAPTSPDVEIVGWTDEVWPSALGAPGRLARPRPARDCEARLPTPRWRQSLRGEAPAAWPPLSSDSLVDVCPILLDPSESEPVHLCGRNYCGQSLQQSGCELELRTAGCGLERSITRAVIDAYGQLCFEPEAGCQSLDAPASVLRRIECTQPDRCVIDWLQAATDTPPLSVLRRQVFTATVSPIQGSIAQPTTGEIGPLQDLLVDDERVIVLSRGSRFAEFGIDNRQSELLFLDPNTLETRQTRVLPDGVGALEWAHDGGSILAAQLNPIAGETALLRLGLDGEVLERHPLQGLPTTSTLRSDVLRHLPAQHVVILVVHSEPSERTLYTFDEASLALRTQCQLPTAINPSDVLEAGPGEIWISENNGDYIPRFSLETCARTSAVNLDQPGNFGMGYFERRPGDPTVFLTLGGVSGNTISHGVLAEGLTLPSRGAAYYEAFMVPTRLAADPVRPNLALAAVHAPDGAGVARVAWFDLEAKLFLPGSAEIGTGIAARLRARTDGVYFLLMGREAGVVRVDTR